MSTRSRNGRASPRSSSGVDDSRSWSGAYVARRSRIAPPDESRRPRKISATTAAASRPASSVRIIVLYLDLRDSAHHERPDSHEKERHNHERHSARVVGPEEADVARIN